MSCRGTFNTVQTHKTPEILSSFRLRVASVARACLAEVPGTPETPCLFEHVLRVPHDDGDTVDVEFHVASFLRHLLGTLTSALS
jgi:hypothetical protein